MHIFSRRLASLTPPKGGAPQPDHSETQDLKLEVRPNRHKKRPDQKESEVAKSHLSKIGQGDHPKLAMAKFTLKVAMKSTPVAQPRATDPCKRALRKPQCTNKRLVLVGATAR